MAKISFATEIKNFLAEFEISANQLAIKSGITAAGLSNIISESSNPRAETIEKIRDGMRLVAQPISSFGQQLKLDREKGAISVSQLAQVARISAQAIYFIESGRTQNPSAKTQNLIIEGLKSLLPSNSDVNPEVSVELNRTDNEISDLEEFDPYSPDVHPEEPGIYIFYDISDRPVYVGQSSNIKMRIRDHEQKFWFKKPIVETASFVSIRNENIRKSFEKVLIKFLKSNAVINKGHVDRSD